MSGMHRAIEAMLKEAPEVTMPDNTMGKAVQVQLTLVGKEISGALSGTSEPDVYRLLTVGMDPNKQSLLVEILVDVNAIQSVARVMPAPLIERPKLV